MKPSEVFAFVAGAAAATGITLLFTTEKGKQIREEVGKNLSKEEIDKLIAKLKRKRANAPSEADLLEEEDGLFAEAEE